MPTPTPAEINKWNREFREKQRVVAEQVMVEHPLTPPSAEDLASRPVEEASISRPTGSESAHPDALEADVPAEQLARADSEAPVKGGATVPPAPDEVRMRLEAAFAKVSVLPGKEHKLLVVLNQLTALALRGRTPGTMAAFRDGGRATVGRELATLSKMTLALAALIEGDNFHQPTILALAAQDVLRSDLRSLVPSLRRIGQAAKQARVGDTPTAAKGGRPRDEQAHLVTRIVYDNFKDLTGKPPTRRVDRTKEGHPLCGPFPALLGGVFAALGMKASPAAWVKAVTEEAKGMGAKRKQETRKE